ncbi:MAG TPA: hypothetical protein VIA06_00345 [Candidatus Dormibacteraeota bacterium]|jgi:hypothetical protein|nr:hypothetical protein [Candidatus Dormibacteraeota bacterium]
MGFASRVRDGRGLALALAAALVACLIAVWGGAATGMATPVRADSGGPAPSLWDRFSTPRSVEWADATGLDSQDMLTAISVEGVYNAAQQPSRLYLLQSPNDSSSLGEVPSSVHVSQLQVPAQQGLLQTLLDRYRGFVKGAVVDDPSNPDTVNLASTMAGLDHAIVIDPSQESMAAAVGIPVVFSFDTSDFTADTPAETYQWGVDNLLARANDHLLVMLPGSVSDDIRDYAIATGAFMFYLTSTDAAEEPVMNTIIQHTPVDTPIMGYIPNEGSDVSDLSSLGHFLNASDFLTNDSFWASLPSPPFLREHTEPAPIAAQPDTVYVAFVVSDGDNAQYMQHQMTEVWQQANLGAVPEGWTVAPGTVDFDPAMLEYFNGRLPRDSELIAGPSGIGYATQTPSSSLTQFGQLSGQIMRRDDIKTADDWESLGDLTQYAQAAGLPSISVDAPLAYERIGNTVVFGQTSGYVDPAQTLFCTVEQQSAGDQAGQPMFLEPLVDGWSITPTDILRIAQQLALAGQAEGLNYVFTTPTQLAQTMDRYYQGKESGLPTANAQSMTGAQVLAEPRQTPSYPSSPVQVTGPNLITNPSGADGTTGWTTAGGTRSADATLSATTYQGQPALLWTDTTTTQPDWIHYYPDVQNGQTYTLSAEVAGSGQVYMDPWNGTTDVYTTPINLTSSFQKLTWTVTIPSDAPTGQTGQAPQLQVRESGAGPVNVYIQDASVQASTPPC